MKTLEFRVLENLLPWRGAAAWRVGFSGGLDSTVLLHVLARLGRKESLPALSAIHIEHGLQAAAKGWPDHCRQVCAALGVPLLIEKVEVQRSSSSLERAARNARYQAFECLLAPAEVLLTAQHRDDQAETLLFRLLRGSGLKGLAGMPSHRALGAGSLLRPLLEVSRSELQVYAQQHQLVWVEDPSNEDLQYSRNYLRHQVLPLLAERWPAVSTVLARTAEHLAEAQSLLDELAAQDLPTLEQGAQPGWLPLPSLDFSALKILSEARQRNALRAFLAPLTELPDSAHWAGWYAMRDATIDAQPLWRLAQGELRRCDNRLWWLPVSWLLPVTGEIEWLNPAQSLQLPGNGQLRFVGTPPSGQLTVRYRHGGETLFIQGRGHRDLKRLLNEARIPALVRDRLPLLYRKQELLAVANLDNFNPANTAGWHLHWLPEGSTQGLS